MVHIRIRSKAIALMVGSLVLGSSAAVQALEIAISQFTVIRNGGTFFDDTFSDNLEPPNGPNGANTYAVLGTIPNTAESGGVLRIDSANGATSFSAIESFRQQTRVRLLSNIDPTIWLQD